MKLGPILAPTIESLQNKYWSVFWIFALKLKIFAWTYTYNIYIYSPESDRRFSNKYISPADQKPSLKRFAIIGAPGWRPPDQKPSLKRLAIIGQLGGPQMTEWPSKNANGPQNNRMRIGMRMHLIYLIQNGPQMAIQMRIQKCEWTFTNDRMTIIGMRMNFWPPEGQGTTARGRQPHESPTVRAEPAARSWLGPQPSCLCSSSSPRMFAFG